MATKREFPALVVNQWRPEWDVVEFDQRKHRRRPPPHFFLFTMPAGTLRALTGIYRRSAAEGLPRAEDLGIQRRHSVERSAEIAAYVQFGYPWSDLAQAKRSDPKFADLRKPGWLPTAIVVNIVRPGDHRLSRTLAAEDAVTVAPDPNGLTARVQLPQSFKKRWSPPVLPLEVIDGQHRLWAFADENSTDSFELPVVAFHGLDISWQAYLFWTINIRPKRINPSLAFDLYPLLRSEDWLERFIGHPIYRETRAQELVEALWSHPQSPWHERIDMLGERRDSVSQAGWIRSLLATFVKSWESGRGVGGLFGTPLRSDETVLPWDRSEQAAFLIMIWREFHQAVSATNEEWAVRLREGWATGQSDDPAFYGRFSLVSTDQGVRGLLGIANDLCFIQADELRLREWASAENESGSATDEERVSTELTSLNRRSVTRFWRDAARALVRYDWRTSAAPGLTRSQQTTKAALRGTGGYRELRLQLLDVLAADASFSQHAKRLMDVYSRSVAG